MQFYAHSAPRTAGTFEPLREHLSLVGERAREFGEALGLPHEAYLAGLLHDLGKYSDLFMQRLRGEARGLDHWTPGFLSILSAYREAALAAAFAVQGHHVGLQCAWKKRIRDDINALKRGETSGPRLTETRPHVLMEHLASDGLIRPPAPDAPAYSFETPDLPGMLDVRMLFSALVDADYIETEAHFNRSSVGERLYRARAAELNAEVAYEALQRHLDQVRAESRASGEMAGVRNDLYNACVEAAGESPGLFTLTAPTGSGKTLAMLAFALLHARAHKLRRVVMVVPYLTVIEQTVRVYRQILDDVFGPTYLLEHHSLSNARAIADTANGDGEQHTEDLAVRTENWEEPLVVTTSVQCLQSLFSNRPSACRKLHRLAKSVILFDEVQTLPAPLAVPTLAALSHLSARYGTSVVFSTATQPAFAHLHERVRERGTPGWRPREIVRSTTGAGLPALFSRARRTRVFWEMDNPTPWETLAQRIADQPQVLCIVNLKRHALRLMELLKGRGVSNLFHLSTNMCPAHRETVLADVQKALKGDGCCLVATQCVEAGVDIDFPVVYRALAPLDAIAQAAGRCHRHGNRGGLEPVYVFRPEREEGEKRLYPPGGYEQAADLTMALYRERGVEGMDIQEPSLFETYYKRLYDLLDSAAVPKELQAALEMRDFVKVAEQYRIIDQDTINVLVPYDAERFRTLKEEVADAGRITRSWLAKARPHSVSLYRPRQTQASSFSLDPCAGRKKDDDCDWFLLTNERLYDPVAGLRGEGLIESLIVG